MDNIFLQTSVLLGITVSIAFIIRFLKQPLLVAYIIAGIIDGPLFLNLLQGDTELFRAFSEFGIVLLLFVVGLSLNFDHIKKIGKVSAISGIGQVLFTGIIGYGILRYLGFEAVSSIYVAIAITFSSTIIIVKLLSDKKDSQSVYGRHVIGLMVVQDLIAILIMVVITSLGGGDSIASVAGALVVKILALAGFVFLLSRYILPWILDRVATSSEFLFIFTIAWCFGVASLLYALGFSIEIGAIIAGLTLGSSPYQPEISSRIRPLRDFFIVIFFVILGSEMQVNNVSEVLIPSIILSIFILFGDSFVLYWLFRLLKFTRRNSFLAGVTAAQVSEFGFVLLFVGIQAGHISGLEVPIFTIVALITIFISSYAITYNEQLYKLVLPIMSFLGEDKYRQIENKNNPYQVWLFGYHRIGWKVVQALQNKKIRFAVVDFDPKAISLLKYRGVDAYFGDAADVEFLSTLPLEKAKIIISTLPEADDQVTLFKHVRAMTKKTLLLGNLYENKYLEDLYESGADYVMMPHLLGGSWMSSILKNEPWTKNTFEKLQKDQKKEMRLHSDYAIDHKLA